MIKRSSLSAVSPGEEYSTISRAVFPAAARGNKIYYSDCESLKVLLSTIKVDSVDGDWGCDKSKKKDKFQDLRGRERETERWEMGEVSGTGR